MYLSVGEGVRLIEVHLSLERFQKEFTERSMDHHIRRVSDGSPELLPELCVLRRVEPGTSWKDDLISLCFDTRRAVLSRQHILDIEWCDSRVNAVNSQGQDLCGRG